AGTFDVLRTFRRENAAIEIAAQSRDFVMRIGDGYDVGTRRRAGVSQDHAGSSSQLMSADGGHGRRQESTYWKSPSGWVEYARGRIEAGFRPTTICARRTPRR